jgi:TrmH family RNA methyltransferase
MSTLPRLSENEYKLLRKLHQKKYRDQLNLYFGEGYRLLIAAFECPTIKIGKIILLDKVTTDEQGLSIRRFASKMRIPVFVCPEIMMRKISDEVTPSGIFFTVEKKTYQNQDLIAANDPVIVFLEQISEPGNLGAILRSMVWFGITNLLLSPGCVDPYNPKTIRASAGAIFETKIYQNVPLDNAIDILKRQGYFVLATVPEDGTPVQAGIAKNRILLLFGSEATGLSAAALKSADGRITIPKSGPVESLNLAVAAGIFFYQIRTQIT